MASTGYTDSATVPASGLTVFLTAIPGTTSGVPGYVIVTLFVFHWQRFDCGGSSGRIEMLPDCDFDEVCAVDDYLLFERIVFM